MEREKNKRKTWHHSATIFSTSTSNKQKQQLKITIMDLLTITAATVFSMYLNASSTGKYYYNADIENNKVCSMTVYDKDGDYLDAKLKYEYLYDNEDRLTRKVVSRWNYSKDKWTNDCCYCYEYTDEGCTVERMKWDEKKHDFDIPLDKAVYSMLVDKVTAVAQYEWNNNGNDFVQTERLLIMNPQNDILIAIANR
jgi:hypothetical protein